MKLKKTRYINLLGVILRYTLALAGEIPIHGFHIHAFNRSFALSVIMPNFIYCPDVTRSVRRDAAKNPEIARLAGLDFPAHEVSSEVSL